jgi:hypothetical protein
MHTQNSFSAAGMSWLGFELSVLRNLKFRSAALALSGEPKLGHYLKRWDVCVAANDPAQWAWTKSQAFIENNTEVLTDEEVELVLADAYVPANYFRNPALLSWFNETDAWWFDNVRANVEKLESPIKRALALTLGMAVGDYVFSFNLETRDLRQPLSLTNVFRRLWQTLPAPVDNRQRNPSTSLPVRTFVAGTFDTDLLFLRLPHPPRAADSRQSRVLSWREEWLREAKAARETSSLSSGRSSAPVETKEQYLNLVEDLLHIAGHLPRWAIAGISDGFVATDELIETVADARKIDAVYTKDYSELLGLKAVIITATA